jgi:hypothetical protein
VGFHDRQGSGGRGGGAAVADYDVEMFDQMLLEWDTAPERQMQSIFTDLVKQAERGYRTTLTFSQMMFVIGVVIIIATFVIEVLYLLGVFDMEWQAALTGGGVLGGLGLGSVVSIFIRTPQAQIQSAIGNLAQVEVAFLSYINQTRGFDWSLVKSLDDNERLLKLISKLRGETMADIERYLEGAGAEPAA